MGAVAADLGNVICHGFLLVGMAGARCYDAASLEGMGYSTLAALAMVAVGAVRRFGRSA
jgi:hypothetical protein